MEGIAVEIQRMLCSMLFLALFAIHVFLGVFEIHLPPWLSRWMFWSGRASSAKPRGPQDTIRSVEKGSSMISKHVDNKKPFVIRGFFHKVTIEELMTHAGPATAVQTHTYENDQLKDETMTFKDLVEKIRRGLSTNAKSIVFEGATKFPPFAGLAEQVDALRGTVGMSWKDLSMQFFIGGQGTLTRCHADPSVNCYLQLSGIKRWKIAPPSAVSELSVLPRGSNISFNSRNADVELDCCLVVDLNPGDLLVLPPFWFHEVTNITGDETVVVGMAMNWLSVKNAFQQSFIMAAGSLLRPRLWKRFLAPDVCPVDEEIMRACRQVCFCSVGLPEEKTAAKLGVSRKYE